MEGRALRILLLLLAGAIAVFWFAKPKRSRVAVVEAGILPPGADAHIEGVTLLQSGPKGDLKLTAADAEWSRETQKFRLNDVRIRILKTSTNGEETLGADITGERGNAATDGRAFELEGKVVATTFDGYRLETSDVRYDHATRQILTDAPVSLIGPGLQVSGRGAEVDYETQRVEIRGRVRAHAVPQVLKEQMREQGGMEVPE